jgi:uncharacterized protein with HEPN domain
MREQVRDQDRLEHILESIDNVLEFTNNIDYECFTTNKMLKFAVVKNIEIIGEAGYKLTKSFREKHNEINWEVIIKMRHILVHGYYQIRDEIAWSVVQKDLEPLKKQIQTIYEEVFTHTT